MVTRSMQQHGLQLPIEDVIYSRSGLDDLLIFCLRIFGCPEKTPNDRLTCELLKYTEEMLYGCNVLSHYGSGGLIHPIEYYRHFTKMNAVWRIGITRGVS